MKKKGVKTEKQLEEEKKSRDELVSIILKIDNKEEMLSFLDDILTENEEEDIIERFILMNEIAVGKSQRNIAKERGLSLCKITRGSKMLKKKNGFMKKYFYEKYTLPSFSIY